MKNFVLLVSMLALGTVALSENKSDSKTIEVKLTREALSLESDIIYSQVSNGMATFKLGMDIIKPRQTKKMPTVVFVTGGGFIGAPKTNWIQQRMEIAEAGYIVASIEYRTIPDGVFPNALEDVKSAIRYLRANADKYGIDKDRIAIIGESAGGYLSAITATTNGYKQFDKGDNLDQSSDVQAAIDIYGLSDLTKVGEDYSDEVKAQHNSASSPEAIFVNGISIFGTGGSINSNPEKAKAANPITYISKDTPPFLLMHGDKDSVVSPSQTAILHKALLEKGIDSTRYIVKGANHADNYWVQPEVMKVIVDFLDENLK